MPVLKAPRCKSVALPGFRRTNNDASKATRLRQELAQPNCKQCRLTILPKLGRGGQKVPITGDNICRAMGYESRHRSTL